MLAPTWRRLLLAVGRGMSACTRGHERSERNTYIVPSTGSRMCKVCIRERDYLRDRDWSCEPCRAHERGCWDFYDDPLDRIAHMRAYHRAHLYAEGA